jgi:hypothetical protein
MRKTAGLVALAALAFGLGAGGQADDDGEKLFLVYSSDERSEIFPCG